jgi:uncharacterized protein (TIGR00255 family)
MTGFGKGEVTDEKAVTVVQLKSVNNRFLELGLKLPSELWAHEGDAKAIIQGALSRGKVDVHWRESGLPSAGPSTAGVSVDSAKAKAWRDALQTTARELGLGEHVSLDQLMRLPGVLGGENGGKEDEAEGARRWKALRAALGEASAQMKASREREGAALAAELEGLLKDGEARVAGIEMGSTALQAAFNDRVKKRMQQVLELVGQGADESRVAAEAALLADKADIREEVVRFREHVAEFRRLLDAAEPVGKKLDFLCQELLREANTMGSKSPEAGLTQAVVGLKSVIERIKEQVQNVE